MQVFWGARGAEKTTSFSLEKNKALRLFPYIRTEQGPQLDTDHFNLHC
jgi:hypothetical protein